MPTAASADKEAAKVEAQLFGLRQQQLPRGGRRKRPLQLFGDLTWNDDLLTALKKLQVNNDLDVLDLHVGAPVLGKPSGLGGGFFSVTDRRASWLANAMGIDSPEELRNLFHRVAFLKHWPPREDPFLGKKLIQQGLVIQAEPLVAYKAKFKVTAGFSCEPGLIIESEQKALLQARQAFGNDADFYYPLFLNTVLVTPLNQVQAANVQTQYNDALDQIFKRLRNKYLPAIKPNVGRGSARWDDHRWHAISLRQDGIRSEVRYEHFPHYLRSRYKEYCRAHQGAQQKQKAAQEKEDAESRPDRRADF